MFFTYPTYSGMALQKRHLPAHSDSFSTDHRVLHAIFNTMLNPRPHFHKQMIPLQGGKFGDHDLHSVSWYILQALGVFYSRYLPAFLNVYWTRPGFTLWRNVFLIVPRETISCGSIACRFILQIQQTRIMWVRNQGSRDGGGIPRRVFGELA